MSSQLLFAKTKHKLGNVKVEKQHLLHMLNCVVILHVQAFEKLKRFQANNFLVLLKKVK